MGEIHEDDDKPQRRLEHELLVPVELLEALVADAGIRVVELVHAETVEQVLSARGGDLGQPPRLGVSLHLHQDGALALDVGLVVGHDVQCDPLGLVHAGQGERVEEAGGGPVAPDQALLPDKGEEDGVLEKLVETLCPVERGIDRVLDAGSVPGSGRREQHLEDHPEKVGVLEQVVHVDMHIKGVVEPVGQLDPHQLGGLHGPVEQPADVLVVGLARPNRQVIESLHEVPFVGGIDVLQQVPELGLGLAESFRAQGLDGEVLVLVVEQLGEHVEQVGPARRLAEQGGRTQRVEDRRGTDAPALGAVGVVQVLQHVQQRLALRIPLQGHTVGDETNDVLPPHTLGRQLHVQGG